MIGNAKMVDWKRAVITWERNRKDSPSVRLDQKTAAFERQRAEADERRRHAAEIATRLLTESGALTEGGAR